MQITGDSYRKKRQEYVENIRKTQRQQIFSKRRNIITQSQPNTMQQTMLSEKMLIVDQRYHAQIQEYLKRPYTMDDFYQLVAGVTTGDILKQHQGAIGIRKLVSVHENPPIQAVIDAGLVPRMIQYVKQESYPQLQLEATWTLTNVASGTTIQCQSIIDKGGIPIFISLLLNKNLGIVQQAVWALGNIASDCTFYRDTILREGGLTNLIKVASSTQQINILKHVAWTVSNLCRGSPLPKYEHVKDSVPVLCDFLNRQIIDDRQILSDICWAVSYNCENNRERIQKVINTGVVGKVVNFLSYNYMPLIVPALRIVGNISTGDANQTEELLKFDVISRLENLLAHPKKIVRRESCWVLSNIAAGDRQQTQTFMERESLMKKLIQLFASDTPDVKKQICWIFSNLTYSSEINNLYQIYKRYDVLNYYFEMLGQKDSKAIEISLECLYVILIFGQKIQEHHKQRRNPLVVDLLATKAVDSLQKLQYHQSEIVYNNVVKILTRFFEIEDPLAT